MSSPKPSPVACSFCGTATMARRWTAREMYFGMPGEFDYIECDQCHSLNIETVPADLGAYYAPAGYGGHQLDVADERPPAWRRLLRAGLTDLQLRSGGSAQALDPDKAPLSWLQHMRATRSWRILDVGCGGGALLKQLHHLGFGDLHGVDKFAPDAPREPGLTIQAGELRDVVGTFDLIMMHHSLEHMVSPADTLTDARSKLAPDGWLLLRVPLIDSAAWQDYGVNWYQLDAPRHLHLPTVAGMQALAKHVGLSIDSVLHDSTASQFFVSEGYRQGRTMIEQRRDGYAHTSADARLAMAAKAAAVNAAAQGDQAAFFCRPAVRRP